MPTDLDRLIDLQHLDTEIEERRKWVTDLPGRLTAFDSRLAERHRIRDGARDALTENQTARRGLEKELAVVQGRLAKFKDQLMEVKTNKEYLAMQHEIAAAQEGVRGFEDRILELLVQADEQTAALKAAEQALVEEERTLAAERTALDRDRARVEGEVDALATRRTGLTREIAPDLVALYATVASTRRGTAVVEVRDGHCTACHVRLRPQLFIELRRSERVLQCESCSRILFALPPAPAASPAQA
jgi:predicted  nucleic acid-binding Zn-ribbon protein